MAATKTRSPRNGKPRPTSKAGQAAARDRRGELEYDVTVDTGRRRKPTVKLQSEDRELSTAQRKETLVLGRDTTKNFAIAGWAIRRHLDYVASFTFQAQTGDKTLDAELERLVAGWSTRAGCDVRRRHPLRRMTRMWEARKVVDGDILVVKQADGRLQNVEGDRIRSPSDLPASVAALNLTHGVQTDAAGAAVAYCVCKRGDYGNQFLFERLVSAENAVLHASWDQHRFDQVRGVTPLSSALNQYRDTYEALEYSLAKAKVAQLFGLVFYREAADSLGDITNATDDATSGTETADTADKSETEVDFTRGPAVLDLEPGDRAEFLENKTPSVEFADFIRSIVMLALKSLDIPYSHYDEAHTNYSGSRLAWLQYEYAAEAKRADLVEVLDEILTWRIMLWILAGRLILPGSMTLADLTWAWVPAGVPWIDPLKEIQADGLAVDRGFSSTPFICKRHGRDAYRLIDEQADYLAYRQQKLGQYDQAPGRPATEQSEVALGLIDDKLDQILEALDR